MFPLDTIDRLGSVFVVMLSLDSIDRLCSVIGHDPPDRTSRMCACLWQCFLVDTIGRLHSVFVAMLPLDTAERLCCVFKVLFPLGIIGRLGCMYWQSLVV